MEAITTAPWQRGRRFASVPRAATKPTKAELLYAAGLLEGEGCFHWGRLCPKGNRSGSALACAMTDKEPLEKLQQLFGGSLRPLKLNPPRKQAWRWLASGARGRGGVMTLFQFMSPRRQEQIRKMLILRT